MLRALTVGVLTVAAAASAVDVTVGLFGGRSLPQGETTAREYLAACDRNISHGDLAGGEVYGAKASVFLDGRWGIEAAAAAYPSFPAKTKSSWSIIEDPGATMTVVTVAPLYKLAWQGIGVYAVAGLGYFAEKLTLTGGGWSSYSYALKGDLDIKAPGAFGGFGLCYRYGLLEAELSPRYAVAWNKGEYDYSYQVKSYDWDGNLVSVDYEDATTYKYYNDSFIDIRAGVNFYLL